MPAALCRGATPPNAEAPTRAAPPGSARPPEELGAFATPPPHPRRPHASAAKALPFAPGFRYNPHSPVGHPAPKRGRAVQFNPFYPAGPAPLSLTSPRSGPPDKSLFVSRSKLFSANWSLAIGKPGVLVPTREVMPWYCGRCRRELGALSIPWGSRCVKCRRIICTFCIARIGSLKTGEVICRDCVSLRQAPHKKGA